MRAKRKAKRLVVPHEPPHPVLAEPMTDAEELALALWLWKSLKCHGALTVAKTGAKDMPTFESVRLGEKAIGLAKKYGVRDEFLALLFEMRLVKVTLTPMET